MTPTGEKVANEAALFSNLNRINAILSFRQQKAFNRWIEQLPLSTEKDATSSELTAFTPEDKYPDEKLKVSEQLLAMNSASNSNSTV